MKLQGVERAPKHMLTHTVSLLKICKVEKVNTKGFGNAHIRDQPSKGVFSKSY